MRRQGHLSRSGSLVRGRARVPTLVCLMPMPVPFLPYLASGMDPGTLEEIGQRRLQQGGSRTAGPGTSTHTECQSVAQTGGIPGSSPGVVLLSASALV